MAGNITETATQVSLQASLSNPGRSPSVPQTSRPTLDQRPRDAPDMIQTLVGSDLFFDTPWLQLITKKEIFAQVYHGN